MITLDLKKEYKALYLPSAKKVELINVPPLQFAMIEGAIEPGASPGNSPSFGDAMQALYGISYALKFMSKKRKENPIDYPVMALEAQWWVEEGEFDIKNPSNWCWNTMILQPDHITPEMFQEGLEQLRKKKPNPALDRLRLERFHEGLSVQILHIGPYAEEPRSLEKMDRFAEENGYHMHGKHHEIYMGDPRRAQPEKLKTVLRHPVKK
jgi:hypothetical protein